MSRFLLLSDLQYSLGKVTAIGFHSCKTRINYMKLPKMFSERCKQNLMNKCCLIMLLSSRLPGQLLGTVLSHRGVGYSTQHLGKANQILHLYDGCFQHDRTMATAQGMSGSGRARGWFEISPDKEKYSAVIENKQLFFFSAPWMINLIRAPGLSLFSFFPYSLTQAGWKPWN